MKAKISEIFKSIQGEGVYQGKVQVFVRFYGCTLNCLFCDTKLKFYEEKTVDEVMESILQYSNYHSVSLTGGEPLLQIDFLVNLCHELKVRCKTIYLETNGILHNNLKRVIDYVDVVAMDFKLPSSTQAKDLWKEHEKFLEIALAKEVFVKAIVGKNTVIGDINRSIELIKGLSPGLNLVLQPENPFEDLLEEKLLSFHGLCISEGVKATIIPQIHKKLGVQ